MIGLPPVPVIVVPVLLRHVAPTRLRLSHLPGSRFSPLVIEDEGGWLFEMRQPLARNDVVGRVSFHNHHTR